MDLLFLLATWHAYAKLRMHTDTTLTLFENTTTALGQNLRNFTETTCNAFCTRELPKEEAARGRRTAAHAAKANSAGLPAPVTTGLAGPKERKLNLSTYKLHSLSDYPNMIHCFGTTDNYTTQIVSYGVFFEIRC